MTCYIHGGPRYTDKCQTPRGTACLRSQLATFKARLTRLKNAKKWAEVIVLCDEFDAFADKYGWPDWWHLFEIARRDAEYEVGRASNVW